MPSRPPAPATGTSASHGFAPSSREPSLRTIFDGSYQFAGLLAPDGTLLEANRAALAFGGVTRDEVVGRPFWDTVWWSDAGDRQRLREAVATAATGRFVRYEVTHVGADGRRAVMDFSLNPVADDDGRVVYIIPEGRDVTEQRRADEARRLSEARLAGIVSLATDAIVSVDEAMRITLFNHGAEQIFGWRADEILGQSLDLLIPSHIRPAHRDHVAAFARSPVASRRMGERRAIAALRRDGTSFPAEASISKVAVDGRTIFTVVLRDVSEQQRADEDKSRLLARETLARAAAESAERRSAFLAQVGAILDASLDHEVALRNLATLLVPSLGSFCVIDLLENGAIRHVEVEHADPARLGLARALRHFPRDRDRPLATRDALQTGRPQLVAAVADDDLRRMAYDAEHLALLRQLAPASMIDVPLVARGMVVGAVLLATDATSARRYGPADVGLAEEVASRAALSLDNARLYEEARRETHLREQVLGIVSHDLRTPLSIAGIHVGILEAELEETGLTRARQAAAGVRDSLEWAHRLIQDLLDVASIEAGRLQVEHHRIDPVVLLVDAAERLSPSAAQRPVTLRVDVPERLPRVEADPERLLQVLANLVGNAIKFTPAGGTITLRARVHEADLLVTVDDTGAGIPPQELPHVFDRFWHARRGAAARGTGLGLAIARGIVEAHGGRIWAESRVGEGSAFHFTLPLPARAP